MFRFHLFVCTLAILTTAPDGAAQVADPPAELLTVAERSEFQATAQHAEVVDLLDRIAQISPLAFRTTVGQTGEGREIPALIIADPPITTSVGAAKQIRDQNKLVVMAIGNIHGGEVCGKEALAMLARELALTESHPLLKDLIIILVPIYNADGNERFALNNRRGQVGPVQGMGQRTNAAGLDLNRDFIKLDAPETQALLRFIRQWDPSVFIDTHTTNGSLHRYLITYEGPKTPAGNQELIEFTRDEMFPALTKAAQAKFNLNTFFYGNFNRDHTRWTTYESTARFGTSSLGLRNRISILSEAYSYATFEERVRGTHDFVTTCFEYAAENKDKIRALLKRIDAATTAAGKNPQPDDLVTLRAEIAAAPEKVFVAGNVEVESPAGGEGAGATKALKPQDFEVELWNRFEPTLTVPRPIGYLIPAEFTNVIEKLAQHGIRVEELTAERDFTVEVYRLDEVSFAEREFQQHRIATVEATPRRETRSVPAGTVLVRTAQPLGNLVVYLLEPECNDGLTAWNFLDDALEVGADFPILRVLENAEKP